MMDVGVITRGLEERLGAQFKLVKEDEDRFRLLNPFIFDDGDNIGIILKLEGGSWVLSDEGHTYFHLTLDVDERSLFQDPRESIINSALSLFDVKNRAGELILPVSEEDVATRIFEFAQTILRIADVSYLSAERVESTFLSDVNQFIRSKLSPDQYSHDWYESRDQKKIYRVDYRINGRPKPVFLFMLPTAGRTKDATITLHQLRAWEVDHTPVGIFEDRSNVSRKDVDRFSDVCNVQYSGLGAPARAELIRLLVGMPM